LADLAAREDRAGLAALRRGLGVEPGTVAEMYPYIEPFLGFEASRRRVVAAYVVASLFGLHPLHADGPPGRSALRGFGAALRAIRFRPDSAEEDPGVARRFVALLDCHEDALPVHLRQLVTLIRGRAEHVPIDYRQLHRDVLNWDSPTRYVQRAWAAGFWSGRGEPESGAGERQRPGDDQSQN